MDNINDLYCGHGPWDFNIQNINDLTDHVNLCETVLGNDTDELNENVVRMPFWNPSNASEEINRWSTIRRTLSQPITTCIELEEAIKKYNKHTQEFSALRYFLDEFSDAIYAKRFFTKVLPGIIKLALRLPELLQRSVPIIKQNTVSSISLSQLQIASLLANAFLCTFPCKSSLCPGINFNRLFASHTRIKRIKCVSEKLKSICHYFDRIIDNEPTGILTFERKSFNNEELPNWENINNKLGETKVCIKCTGLIEDDADGCLQVDFANKNVGGGVLAYGCVQEEIRFIICPELLISRLFTEQLGSTEALVITGAERYSTYTGYGDSYEWSGDYIDNTPLDAFARRRTTIVAIDATRFTKSLEQYKTTHVLRELNKAFSGFHSNCKEQLPAVATGNWGCGAYRGDPNLKFLIQLMACNISKRDMVYFTFNNNELSTKLKEMYLFLKNNNVTICQLWEYLKWFSLTKLKADHLYTFIYYIHFNKTMYSLDDFSNFSTKNFQNLITKQDRNKKVANNETNEDDLNDLSVLFQSNI
ncbi:hypothetical protein RN001_004617 [Aquatica leii]|uniref:poly(ADP-ribose) glycohydrolase n=1 Tax=Aquatica leii TaxID=1421715 RepID=A0AAN7QJP5_9COLE|nr:hypothetical protein RN001_004617 [Aquatica leii]